MCGYSKIEEMRRQTWWIFVEVEVLDRKGCVFLDARGVFAWRLLGKQVPPRRLITGAHHKLLSSPLSVC